jgi:selenide,water dikinase
VDEARRRLACDATTSGGLLVALPADAVGAFDGTVIGRMVDGEPGTISLL